MGRLPLLVVLLFPAVSAYADVTVQVTLSGQPNSRDETFVAKSNGCGESPIRHTENWKVGPKGELGDVVVWIVDPKFESVAGYTAPPEIEIKQIGCRYIPHVVAVQAGENFKVINGDPTIHNIRAKVSNGPGQPPGADVFNFGQPAKGQVDERFFSTPGLYSLQCDVHGWMQAWIMALSSRCYGVTALDGQTILRASNILRDGDYKIDAWHPRFTQTLEQTVQVKKGIASAVFVFDGSKSF